MTKNQSALLIYLISLYLAEFYWLKPGHQRPAEEVGEGHQPGSWWGVSWSCESGKAEVSLPQGMDDHLYKMGEGIKDMGIKRGMQLKMDGWLIRKNGNYGRILPWCRLSLGQALMGINHDFKHREFSDLCILVICPDAQRPGVDSNTPGVSRKMPH